MPKLKRPTKKKEEAVLALYMQNLLTIDETAYCLGMSSVTFRKYYPKEIEAKKQLKNNMD